MIYLQIKENKKELTVDAEYLNSSLKKFIGTSEKQSRKMFLEFTEFIKNRFYLVNDQTFGNGGRSLFTKDGIKHWCIFCHNEVSLLSLVIFHLKKPRCIHESVFGQVANNNFIKTVPVESLNIFFDYSNRFMDVFKLSQICILSLLRKLSNQ